ncbi:hypothetical protein H8E88_11390 [candidate division KSB1 bacterium]|nr:hypothetical protein [candidate division KSB1 bacterium]MBL7093638.1 hypothetical protein [candidate division KSB1 bacterium]
MVKPTTALPSPSVPASIAGPEPFVITERAGAELPALFMVKLPAPPAPLE